MTLALTDPSIGSTSWGGTVNGNFDAIKAAVTAGVSTLGSGAISLTASNATTWLRCATGAQTITLPASSVGAGVLIAVLNDNAPSGTAPVVVAVQCAGADVIFSTAVDRTSLALLSRNWLVLESNGSTGWIVRGVSLTTDWLDGGAVPITATAGNPTKGPVSSDRFRWRRINNELQAEYRFYQTSAGTNVSGTYLIGLPVGTIDTSLTGTAADTDGWDVRIAEAGVGSCWLSNVVSVAGNGNLFVRTGGTIGVSIVNIQGTSGYLWSSGALQIGGSGIAFRGSLQVPIIGW